MKMKLITAVIVCAFSVAANAQEDPAHNELRAVRDGLLAGILLLLVAPNGFVDLITMYGYFLGRFDAKAHFVAADFYDDNRNVIINNDALVLFP